MTVHVFLNGDFAPPLLPIGAGDFCIAVDGGIRHAQTLGITPHLWLGDFDSSVVEQSALTSATQIQRFPREKDCTDWELALQYLREHYPRELVQVIGAWGDEWDHSLANVWVLPRSGLSRLLLVSQKQQLWFMHGQSALSLTLPPQSIVSLLALTPLQGVCTQGLQWPLQQALVEPFSARACRNIVQESEVKVCWQMGAGLCIAQRFS